MNVTTMVWKMVLLLVLSFMVAFFVAEAGFMPDEICSPCIYQMTTAALR